MIDGASFFQIFRRILLLYSGPIIIVDRHLSVHQHMERLPVRRDLRRRRNLSPMTVALYNIVNTSTGVIEYNVNMAAAIIAAAPTLFCPHCRRTLFRARPDGLCR